MALAVPRGGRNSTLNGAISALSELSEARRQLLHCAPLERSRSEAHSPAAAVKVRPEAFCPVRQRGEPRHSYLYEYTNTLIIVWAPAAAGVWRAAAARTACGTLIESEHFGRRWGGGGSLFVADSLERATLNSKHRAFEVEPIERTRREQLGRTNTHVEIIRQSKRSAIEPVSRSSANICSALDTPNERPPHAALESSQRVLCDVLRRILVCQCPQETHAPQRNATRERGHRELSRLSRPSL